MIKTVNDTLDLEIRGLLQVTYQSLRTHASQHGISLPPTPPDAVYTDSPLVQHIRYLMHDPADPAPILRNIAALLHGYPPLPNPYPIPDWFWERMPTLANTLVAQSDLWIPLATAAQRVRRSSAVLVSVEDWDAIQETLYLLSVPGMRESIKKGMAEPLAKSARELKW